MLTFFMFVIAEILQVLQALRIRFSSLSKIEILSSLSLLIFGFHTTLIHSVCTVFD